MDDVPSLASGALHVHQSHGGDVSKARPQPPSPALRHVALAKTLLGGTHQMMLRSVHLPLGFGVSPLLRCLPSFSGLASLPAVASCSWSRISASPEGFPLDVPYSRQHGVFRAFRMSSGGPGTSPDVDAALGSAVAPPAVSIMRISL